MIQIWRSLTAAHRRLCLALLGGGVLAALASVPARLLDPVEALKGGVFLVGGFLLLVATLAQPQPRHPGEDDGSDDGGGGSRIRPPAPEGPGGGDADWERFERQFRAYAAGRDPVRT
jgi:hypothetical protein